MDSTPSNSWSKLYNITNKTFLKILVDKESLNNYKEKCEELNREITLNNEQAERYAIANKTLQTQVATLKASHERKIKDLPFYSNTFKHLTQCLTDTQKLYNDREDYLKGIEHDMKLDYENLVEESDNIWPESRQLKQEKLNLCKLELELKMLLKAFEDESEKIKLKKFLDKKMFNASIVEFVTRIKEQKENVQVIAEIEKYRKNGNLLLKEYEKAIMNADKRKKNEEFVNINTMWNNKKNDLPQITPLRRSSPTPSISSVLNSSCGSKINCDNSAFKNYKQRELERKKRLRKLSKRNILDSMYKNPPAESQINSQPTPEIQSKKKVEVLNQIFLTPKHNNEIKPAANEQKLSSANNNSQFGKAFEMNHNFCKPMEIESTFTHSENIVSKQAPTDKAEETVKQGPINENKSQEQNKGELQQARIERPKRSFEKDESTFFPPLKKTEQKEKTSLQKPENDDVFKVPRPYDTSFDFINSSYNQMTSENESQNLLERSYGDMPSCFSPPHSFEAENNEGELMFPENNESPLGTFFFFK